MRAAVVCVPPGVERHALGPALGDALVVHSGLGPRRTRDLVDRLGGPAPDGARPAAPRPVLVGGVAGALRAGIAPGDLVVADEVRGDGHRPVAVPSARPLAAALRRLGLTVHVGPVHTAERTAGAAERTRLAATGAIAVDTESAWLAALAGPPGAGGAPLAVVRAIVGTVGTVGTAGTVDTAGASGPGPALRGFTSLRSLRRAAPALGAWVAATGEREVVLAQPRSFCAGVDRAIDTVERALERHGAPVYVRRQIVHNTHVVRRLAQRGAVFVEEADQVPAGAVLVLAAHGVSPAVRAAAGEQGRSVIDATCPLVTKVHAGVRRQAARGATVVLIGHAEHEEVEGTVGEAAGLPGDVVVVATEAEAEAVEVPDPSRVAYAVQTTLAVDEAERIAAVLARRFPALAGPRRDDICYATTNRQQAMRTVAGEVDLMIVVGSPNSSNSVRLVEVAAADGVAAHRVDAVDDLDLERLAGVARVGVTAGASAPDHLVDELVAVLRGLGPVSVVSRSTVTEDVRFALPKEVG